MGSVYYNGKFIKKTNFLFSIENRGLRYGDSFFETIKCDNGNPLFWDEHYFRIAGSFCVLQMDPPTGFDMEQMKSIIQNVLTYNDLHLAPARVRITFFRVAGGYYLPQKNNVSFFIEAEKTPKREYQLNKPGLNVTFYRENLIAKNNISNVKSNNKLINILASIYAKNNKYDDCILLNQDQDVVESISGNIFIVSSNTLITPLLNDGCVDGVMRRILLKDKSLNTREMSISISDVLNAEEVFLTNVISGIKWISSIRNNTYEYQTSKKVIDMLNKRYLV